MRRVAILRPEPGNAATAARVVAAGAIAIRLPLFAVRPLAWLPPAAGGFDALLLTSANAVRHAGPALAGYRALPIHAVGAATAAAARAAGLDVVAVGDADAATLAAGGGFARALHLAGRDRASEALRGVAATIAVYASDPLPIAAERFAELAGSVALVHSPRAGARLAELVEVRTRIAIAAISARAAAAAGAGWASVRTAAVPSDAALIAAALAD